MGAKSWKQTKPHFKISLAASKAKHKQNRSGPKLNKTSRAHEAKWKWNRTWPITKRNGKVNVNKVKVKVKINKVKAELKEILNRIHEQGRHPTTKADQISEVTYVHECKFVEVERDWVKVSEACGRDHYPDRPDWFDYDYYFERRLDT